MEKKRFENGVHDISNDDYHSSEGVSRSALWKIRRSPAHYYHEHINPYFIKSEPTPDMVMGSLVHTLALEPDKLTDEYAVKPELEPMPPALKLKDVGREAFDKNKTEREAVSVHNELLLEEFKLQSQEKRVVTREQLDKAREIAESVLKDNIATGLIDGSSIEQSIYFTHELTGIQCKVRPDSWLGSIVTDLKTTRDASFKAFQSDAFRSGYFLQAGMISKALESIGQDLERFLFVCVEKTEPYAVGVYDLDDAAIEYGVTLFDDLMMTLKECMTSNRWPAYPMQVLTLPGWAKYE